MRGRQANLLLRLSACVGAYARFSGTVACRLLCYITKCGNVFGTIQHKRSWPRCRAKLYRCSTVPLTRPSSLDDHAFPVAAAWAWNALPSSVRTSSTCLAFRHELNPGYGFWITFDFSHQGI